MSLGWHPKLVALDIDGTLVDHDQKMPGEVCAAVARIVESGTPVVIATGRGWSGAKPIVEALGLPPGPHVCSNGAVTVAYPPLEVRNQVTFDPTDVIGSVARLAPGALIAVEEVGHGYRVNRPFPAGDLSGTVAIETVDELCARPVTRIIIFDPDAEAADFATLAHKLGLHGVTYYVGWSAWLDIAPEGVNKATALAAVCDDLGIEPEDVLALGDGHNDVEMLQWAGRGVAMGDASVNVQKAAKAVTGRFADGGTAAELQRWFY